MNPSTQEKLVGDLLRTSFEAMTLEDLGSQVLPLLERLFDTSASLLYRCGQGDKAFPIAGTLVEASREYYEVYAPHDPIQTAVHRHNHLIARAHTLPEWKNYLRSAVYHEFQRPRHVENFVHVRLLKDRHNSAGMVGMLLARSKKQPEFSEQEGILLAQLLPGLQALARRSERLEEKLQGRGIVESMLDASPCPKMAMDLQGRLLWASEHAASLLKLYRSGRTSVPTALVQAVRRLGEILGKSPGLFPAPDVTLPRGERGPIHAELRLAHTRSGVPFIIIELMTSPVSPPLQEVAARFQLTTAETHTLDLLSKGFSDREIGRHLFISMATVRTHVGNILAKLSVSSRVQAALVAHGHRPQTKRNQE